MCDLFLNETNFILNVDTRIEPRLKMLTVFFPAMAMHFWLHQTLEILTNSLIVLKTSLPRLMRWMRNTCRLANINSMIFNNVIFSSMESKILQVSMC